MVTIRDKAKRHQTFRKVVPHKVEYISPSDLGDSLQQSSHTYMQVRKRVEVASFLNENRM